MDKVINLDEYRKSKKSLEILKALLWGREVDCQDQAQQRSEIEFWKERLLELRRD